MGKELKNSEGYIYVYKCIVGPHNDICKVGKTKHFGDYSDRLKQHSRTTYYGFVPYTDFITGNPIATGFKVKNMDSVDSKLKVLLKDSQVSKIEIFNIDYDELIEKIYRYLIDNDEFIELIKDGISSYDFINDKQIDNVGSDLRKKVFEKVRDQLLAKYADNLPEELFIMLRDKDDFKSCCSSHYKTGNYIEFPNNLILDINFNRIKKSEILDRLKEML